jgi:4-hydroxybenzoate polyprenyltransferase
MKVSLDFTQNRNSRILRSNTHLLKGLNISNILILARLEAFLPICFFCTTVGLHIADSSHRLISLLTIGLANTFAMVATCAFNDAEDAPEDMLAHSTRNVIALGKASKGTGYLVAALAAAISLLLSIIAGTTVFLIILVFLVTTFLYSWRRVRMKAMPFGDICTHIIMGGLIFLSSAWSSQEGIIWKNHVLPICLIFSFGTALALLAHQLFDYEDDLAANIRTTVVVLGKRKTYWIKGCFYFLIVCLLTKEYLSGFFPFKLILSFFVVAVCLILLSIALYPKQAVCVSKRMIPWAVNTGAVAATLMWYIS